MNVYEALHSISRGGTMHSATCRYWVRLGNNGIFRKKLDVTGGPWTDKDYPFVMNMQALNATDWTISTPQPAAPPPESTHEEATNQG